MIRIAWLPQRGNLTRLYMPDEPLPDGESEAVGFSFALAALQSGQINRTFQSPFLLWGITAHDSQAPGFTMQVWHQLANGPRRLANRHSPAGNTAGTAQYPLILRRPYLIDAGDGLTVEVKNLDRSANTSNIQVALFGVSLPRAGEEAA